MTASVIGPDDLNRESDKDWNCKICVMGALGNKLRGLVGSVTSVDLDREGLGGEGDKNGTCILGPFCLLKLRELFRAIMESGDAGINRIKGLKAFEQSMPLLRFLLLCLGPHEPACLKVKF